jgi:uncharacterized protein (DUF427 family)
MPTDNCLSERAMAKAIWRDKVLAESERFELIEGNVYFPPEALNRQYFKPSVTTTICPWKGTAHYYTVVVDGRENPDAAWYYPSPKPAAAAIAGHVAFWHGVTVER